MRNAKWVAAAAIVVGSALGLAALASSSSGNWEPGASLLQPRSGAAVVSLGDGRVLFSGGRDGSLALASAETLGRGDARAVGDMTLPRSRHAAALLPDGRVLVVGGEMLEGLASASAEIYDPASASWRSTAEMHAARAGHTLTTLRDGGLLVAGGESSGVPSALLEIFDPAGGVFYDAGVLATPRSGHAAAMLDDGRVLIAGGSDGARALASTELFDPMTGEVTPGPTLQQARVGLTATTLADGRVLVVGGLDDHGPLASAELLDAAATGFAALGETLLAPRSGHLALRLPHNNNVLIVSGDSAVTPLATAELYTPVTGGFDATGALAVSRALSSGQALGEEGALLLGGGSNDSGTLGSSEIYVFHTVRTDRNDYAPGQTVTIMGRRWAPGETVTLVLHEMPQSHDEITLTAVADAEGNFVNTDFAPDQDDLGVKFVVDAIGQDSGLSAQTVFTDGTLNVVSAPTGVSFTLQATRYNNSTNCTGNSQPPSTHSVSNSGPSPGFANSNLTGSSSFRLLAGATGSGGGAFQDWNCSNASNLLVLGGNPRDICVSGFNGGGVITQCTATYVAKVNTTISISDTPDPSVVGQPVTVGVTVAPASGGGTPGGSVVVTVAGGSETCTAVLAGGSGSCQLSFTSTGSRTLNASYGGDAGFNASNGSATHTIQRANSSTTISSVTPEPSVVGQSYSVSWTVAAVAPGSGTPTGTVNVSDSDGHSCSGSAPSGSCVLPSSSAGSKTVTVNYAGDGNFAASSGSDAHTVNPAATTTSITADTPDPTVVGQPYTVSWNVSVDVPGAGAPSGSVTVSDGDGHSCNGSAPSGSCQLPSSSAGDKNLLASYGGDANFSASSGGALHSVLRADTTTTLGATPSPSTYGQPVSFSAEVCPAGLGAGTPTGFVEFSVDGTPVATALLVPGVTCPVASTSSAALAAGAHTVTAAYLADTDFNASSDSLGHTVDKASTATSITADTPDPSVVGQSYTVSWSVSVLAPGAGTRTGNVTVSDGSGASCVAAIGAGQCSLASTGAGPHTLSASYAGDGNFHGSAGNADHQVDKADTTTTITSDTPDPSVVGESYTVSWSVTVTAPGAGTPTGTVTVSDGSGASCVAAVASGQCSLVSTAAGAKTLSASYAGDANFNASSGSDTHQVNRAATRTTITGDTPDPSVVGQAYTVSWDVDVTAPGAGTPTGTVAVSDGSGASCSAAVAAGQCSLTSTSAGPRTLNASYAGDANFEPSSGSAAHQVDKADTTLTLLGASPEPSVTGQVYTVSWSLAVNAPGAGSPTGTVTVSDGAGGGCSAAASAGSCAMASPTAGHKTLSASYGGDADFNGDNATLNGHQVNPAQTATALGSSLNPSVFGNSVTFTATVCPVAPGAGVPTGTVSFAVDGSPASAAPLAWSGSGCPTASYSTAALSAGAHAVQAAYAGSADFLASSASHSQTVNPLAVTETVSVTPNPQQYSDLATFTATIDPAAVNGLAPATSATFYVGTQLLGTDSSATLSAGQLVWTLSAALLEPSPYGTSPTGQMAPGARTVTVVFGGVNPNFTVQDATTTLTVSKEDARTTYTGALYVGTSSATATTAKATLAATVQDITATSDAAGDTSFGDIRTATVSFVNRDAGNAVLCTGTIGLVDAADTRTGTATCEATLSVGSCPSAPCSQSYTVGIVVNGYYTRNDSADNSVVTVSQPGSNFITGGGYLLLNSSAGQTAGGAGSKNNFGFNVKYNKSKTNLQGHINSIVRNNGRVYQIKGTSMTSLAVQTTTAGGTATFNGKANIQDITNPLAVIAVDGNATLQVTLTDNGEPGSSDRIGITVWNKNGGLWFSSNWNGSKTVEQGLGGGNVVVH